MSMQVRFSFISFLIINNGVVESSSSAHDVSNVRTHELDLLPNRLTLNRIRGKNSRKDRQKRNENSERLEERYNEIMNQNTRQDEEVIKVITTYV